MANRPARSTAKRGEINIGSGFRLSFALLDVLYANQFEGQLIDPEVAHQTEQNFYRGAPPKWLNFHISEQAEPGGTPFIKRDGYKKLVEQIQQRRKLPGVSTVKLFHQPGCGGTTLAMKVLWDLRKTFRSAVLTGSTPDITDVAEEVVDLFTAGDRGDQNTVLLLVNNEKISEDLQDVIMMKIAERNIVTHKPVVIFLSCVRKNAVLQSDHVFLPDVLSDTEKQKFDEKKKEIYRRYSDKCSQFHGFNIMQTNFSEDYVEQACEVLSGGQSANKPKKTQLAAFLSLLNAYVPGSYLLESQCLDFFKSGDYIHGDSSLEDRMKPFSHLIVTFQQDKRSEKKVCMAHPMIAQCCTELMARAGVKRSDTARDFITCLCRDELPPFLVGFIKDMLTRRKRVIKEENPVNSAEMTEDLERFSRLILDIQKLEGKVQSASVLEMATKKFKKNPFFPQALARFYYIELKDYCLAEMWANTAKSRDPLNSFIADTLGQVHKNHLKKIERSTKPREILQLATKAIEAFKDEERLAEKERGTDMKGHVNTKISHYFNTRGLLGYLEVCIIVYDLLVSQNEIWRGVLTKQVSLVSVLEVLGDNKLLRFNHLIKMLRVEVERKCAFYDKYLTFSKPDMTKDDPSYITEGTTKCYSLFVVHSPSKKVQEKGADLIQNLKQKFADTFARVLSCLDRECTESDLQKITTWWEEIFLQKDSVTALANYILAQIMLKNIGAIFPLENQHLTAFKEKEIPEDSPELQMLTLLLCWPTDSEDKCILDFSKLISRLHCSYEHAYKIHFRSRYLCPLFFIGKGQDLNRIVHRKVIEEMFLEENEETTQHQNTTWSEEKIFKSQTVQAHLLRVEGVVRNYRVFATFGGTVIEVDANLRNKLWRPRQVSFYLGFTIRGAVAFDIQTKPAEMVQISETESSELSPVLSALTDTTGVQISETESSELSPPQSALTDTTGGEHFVDRYRTALINGVRDTGTILEKLKDQRMISNEDYEAVRALETTQDQMSGILQCLTSAGTRGKDALYDLLKRMKSMRPLIVELEESE
ncbi:sterile alpha motif domain-containing protein 9-like [Centropristis striata]|uniref:sterile alpha motif domain-containing protein 9-like n=1 Tax=Centropristis striata TaxID=184440 RepID=UPI0027E040D8|nr:sterile alpha motif domain-containing protein 9-like [Centropristis striata]